MNTAEPSAAATAEPSFADVGTGSALPPSSDRRFAAITTAVFAVVVGVLLWRHAPWRDELQAWAIVRDNANPLDVLSQLRYEGHPALWYAVLWLPARITRSINALQFVQWILAVIAATIVARSAPFPRAARVLILASYFPLFEFGVIARSYTLVWLITVATLALLPRRRGLIALGVGAFLLANTTVLAIPFALALVVGVLLDRRVQPAGATRATRIFAGVAGIAGALLALLTARPAADAQHATTTLDNADDRFAIDLSAPLRALAPLSRPVEHFWNTHLLDGVPTIAALLALVVIGALAWVLRGQRAALVVWLTTALTVPAILYSRNLFASYRFCGVIFVAAVAALWLARLGPQPSRGAGRAALVLGAVGTVGTLLALVGGAGTPFTGARATAQWLRDNRYGNAPIVCRTNYQCSSVGIRLDRPTEATNQEGRFTYSVFRSGAPLNDNAAVISTASARATEEGTPVIVLTSNRPDDPRARVVAHFGDSVVEDETYWVSVVEPQR